VVRLEGIPVRDTPSSEQFRRAPGRVTPLVQARIQGVATNRGHSEETMEHQVVAFGGAVRDCGEPIPQYQLLSG
jgi:hypothetical protein